MGRLSLLPILWATAYAAGFDWKLPFHLLPPAVPADNPMSAAKVELGRHLFYDRRMSLNGRQSCASCHRQELAFTDGKERAEGTTGELHPRSSMSLVNVAYVPLLTWANPELKTLEDQALIPMFGENPIELGLKGREAAYLEMVRADDTYRALFAKAYPDQPAPYTIANVVRAIAAFERTIISMNSAYDRYHLGHESSAMTESARRGELLFFSKERAGCFQCHETWTFGGEPRTEGGQEPHVWFRNTGLYDSRDAKAYPPGSTGIHEFTGARGDVGRFRSPSLRNIAVTAPYMHDGSIRTLEEAIDHYAAGGRVSASPGKSSFIRGFQLTGQEKRDLVEFLKSLTDPGLLKDPRWSDPWHR
jgi:cytochrome c peroxidase